MKVEPYYTQKERQAICRTYSSWPEALVLHVEIGEGRQYWLVTLSCGHVTPRKQRHAIVAADEPGATSRVICEACARGMTAA